MNIFVTDVNGNSYTVMAQPTDTVSVLKNKIKEKTDADPSRQRLVFAGKQLEDVNKLQDYSIQSGSTIFMVLRLRGGLQIFDRVLTRKPIIFEAEPAYRIERIQESHQLLNFQEDILKMTTLFKTNQS